MINVDLRRYGEDEEYKKFMNNLFAANAEEKKMSQMIFDEEGLLDEPCLSCNRAYIKDVKHGWHCKEKECPYQKARKRMTGCTKTGVKNAIEAVGQYLIDNSERIAGDFNMMIGFDLEVKFKTNNEEVSWPEIRFTNHHYLPYSEELSEKIFNAEDVEDENNKKVPVEDRNCDTCKYQDLNLSDDPCIDCDADTYDKYEKEESDATN